PALSSSTNATVWYSTLTFTGTNLATIYGTAFDQPQAGPGAGANTTCTKPGFDQTAGSDGWPASGWPGGAVNICAEDISIEDTNTDGIWDGNSFNQALNA